MPLILKFNSMDEEFRRYQGPKIILNDLPAKTEADREYFLTLTRQTFNSDIVSVMPRCDCPDDIGLKGEHVLGEVCDICNTPVRRTIDENIESMLWFRQPAEIEKLISPIILIMLLKRFSKSKYSVIQWLIDRSYRPVVKMPAVVLRMQSIGIKRGYNYFVQNFDEIMKWLFSQPEFVHRKTSLSSIVDMLELTDVDGDPLRNLVTDKRDILFSEYLPIPNRSLLVLEKSALGIYGEGTTFDIQNTLNTMLSIDRDYYDQTLIAKENRTAKILLMLASYYLNIFDTNMSPKPALLRKHVYGARGNHCFRAVITSHEGPHDHDEIHIPWCVASTVYQLHIIPRLLEGGVTRGGIPYRFTLNEAIGYMYGHVNRYSPILDELFENLIAQSKYNGQIALLQRNPSLAQGSAQRVRITKVKKDPMDTTVSISDLVCAALNADYDGELSPSLNTFN